MAEARHLIIRTTPWLLRRGMVRVRVRDAHVKMTEAHIRSRRMATWDHTAVGEERNSHSSRRERHVHTDPS